MSSWTTSSICADIEGKNRRPAGQRLMIKVLASAVDDLESFGAEAHECRACARSNAKPANKAKNHGAHAAHYAQALLWVQQDSEVEYPFAFGNICDVIGLDPGRMRVRIQEIDRAQKERAR